ncbi:MAG TPA: glycosyltransferase family 9 protein [Nitrospiraceae bacterium]|nr:glycosyltransferase family 9 protein [Nitrospiraceae bacterium]
MNRRVLLINITRMGDLVQMGTLLERLQQEWPGAAVDLIVDQRFAPVAELLPHLQRVVTYDFHALVDETRVNSRDVVTLYREIAGWALPLTQAGYDRIINLTFNKRSGFLASYIGAREIRGVAAARDGRTVIHNDWMAYLTDMHHHRRFNRFNLVDIYAWGGSGRGSFAPLSLKLPEVARHWARAFLGRQPSVSRWMAVQVGASDVMKAWRPEYFGRTLAHVSKRSDVGMVFIGTPQEEQVIQEAARAYRAAGGGAGVAHAAGRTDLVQLAALLAECRLLLTNDTGPMHLAVAVGTPVIDVSVGHVDFHETGPYGPGHWVVQPDLGCAPCGFDQVCFHHACKDRFTPEDVAALCLHVLGAGPFPHGLTGARIYESAIDEDSLATYRLRAGREDSVSAWYGSLWRRIWFESFTGTPSACVELSEPPPDLDEVISSFEKLLPLAARLVSGCEKMVTLVSRSPLPVGELKQAQVQDDKDRAAALDLAMRSPASGPATIALLRDLQSDDGTSLVAMARSRTMSYQRWHARLTAMEDRLRRFVGKSGRSATSRPLVFIPSVKSA